MQLTAVAWLVVFGSVQQARPVELREDLRLGERFGELTFSEVVGLAPFRDGSAAIADEQSLTVTTIDRSGTVLRRIGRRGAGPGEFQSISAIGAVQDTLWVADPVQNRISYFTFAGDLLRTEHLPAGFNMPRPILSGVTRDGWLLVKGGVRPTDAAQGSVPMPIVAVSKEGNVRTLLHVEIPESTVLIATGRVVTATSNPFSPRPAVALAPDGRWLARVQSESDSVFSVRRVDESGHLLHERNYKHTPVQLDRSVADRILDELAQRLSGGDRQQGHRIRQILAHEIAIPTHAAVLAGAIASSGGDLWIALTGGPAAFTQKLLVLDAQGNPAGTARLPPRHRLLAATRHHLWTTSTDELDVPYVHRFAIHW